ncbi:MAG: hypothetical protein KDG89_13425 [Geminicoccaceae bacterium]|nr:hypothetical protein [Geminicoccaceae bacterium]
MKTRILKEYRDAITAARAAGWSSWDVYWAIGRHAPADPAAFLRWED